jgi:hypothetical protein
MMVIDEALGVGWFASDRYQPEDKVCVYTFVPNDSRNPLDYENEDNLFVRQKAMLCPIAVTWTPENEQVRIRARQRLSLMLNNGIGESAKSDFTLVINDYYTYTSFDDFKSKDAVELCREWLRMKERLQAVATELDSQRTKYHSASRSQKQNMRKEVMALEQEYEKLVIEVSEAEKNVRNAEIRYQK